MGYIFEHPLDNDDVRTLSKEHDRLGKKIQKAGERQRDIEKEVDAIRASFRPDFPTPEQRAGIIEAGRRIREGIKPESHHGDPTPTYDVVVDGVRPWLNIRAKSPSKSRGGRAWEFSDEDIEVFLDLVREASGRDVKEWWRADDSVSIQLMQHERSTVSQEEVDQWERDDEEVETPVETPVQVAEVEKIYLPGEDHPVTLVTPIDAMIASVPHEVVPLPGDHLADPEWELRITTFIGAPGVPHAQHYRGEMRRSIYVPLGDYATYYRESLTVEEAMDEAWAKNLNEAPTLIENDYVYYPGEFSERYLDRDRLIERAKYLFGFVAQPGDYLVEEYAEEDEPILAGEEPEDRYHKPWSGTMSMGGDVPKFKDIRRDAQELTGEREFSRWTQTWSDE